MRRSVFFAIATFLWGEVAEAQCLDPNLYSRAVVSIHREDFYYLEDLEPTVRLATGWFPDAWHLRTNAHVVDQLRIGTEWTDVTLYLQEHFEAEPVPFKRRVRVVEYARRAVSSEEDVAALMYRPQVDDTARLRLDAPVPGSWRLKARAEPAKDGERVFAIGYPEDFLRWVQGTVVRACVTASDRGCRGQRGMYVQLRDRRNSPDAMYQGSSGSPIMDCNARVIGTNWSTPGMTRMTASWFSPYITTNIAAPIVPQIPSPPVVSEKATAQARR